jgi:hypothetical protein
MSIAMRRTRSRWFAAAAMLAAMVLGGCGDDALSSTEIRELSAAKARWDAQRLTHYTVEMRVSCFCVPIIAEWHELTVADNVVTDARLVVTPGSVLPPGGPVDPENFPSVDRLFARIVDAGRATDGSRVEARYDDTTGLPVEISFFAPPNTLDGGATYYLRALKPALIQ